MSSPVVGIVVTDSYSEADPDHDTPLLLAALRERGAVAEPVVWHREPEVAGYDLLVLRSPWDYPERPADFLAWLDRAEAQTRVLNTPATVRWNLDKRYLARLAGIPVIPTVYATSHDAARNALADHAAVVVKPTVSAGARDTGLFEAGDPRALTLARSILDGGGTAMIQPEIPELSAGAEKALYLIDGILTHAIAKGAILARGGGVRGGVYQEHPVPAEVTPAEAELAHRILDAVTADSGEPLPLYARIDIVDTPGGVLVLEVELIEPALNLHVAPHAVAPVAEAILRAARRVTAANRSR